MNFTKAICRRKIECGDRVIVASGDFEANTLLVEHLNLRSGVPHLVRGSHRVAR
jgi:hypothetical protein